MTTEPDRALELLRLGTQRPDATFRDGQEEAIRHLVEGRGRLLVVQKTGWGKSAVYFIATKLLREAGLGPVLLVSPLLSLMRNQLAAAERMGVRARTINSVNLNQWKEVEEALERDEVDILLISPERLANERFETAVLQVIGSRISMLVIDEAHCISDWGHDFRPHYRLIERIARNLPSNLRLLATTATANDRVLNDLDAILGPNLTISRGALSRPSLVLQTIHLPTQEERMAWLAEQLPEIDGSGIIYTLTIRDSKRVAEWLRTRGLNVEAYSSESADREVLESALLDNRVKALVATTALGMGFDKPDLAFVIHFQAPGSAVAYYQQVGRAGRAIESAHGVLLSGEEDTDITDFFIESAFPREDEVEAVLAALNDAPVGLSERALQERVNVRKSRIDKTLQLLSLESPPPIVKDGTKWQLTASELSGSFWERAKRLTELRHEEHEQMKEYSDLADGHMEFLISALDGKPEALSPIPAQPLPSTVDETLVLEAIAFLRRRGLSVDPRLEWPPGGLPLFGVSGKIRPEHRTEPGKALSVWMDGGWGRLVRAGKYEDGHFSDRLVQAAAELLREWNPDPAPAWVASIPSLRHPHLVPDFARRLATALGLPFSDALKKTEDRPEQKTMENSPFQARNVDGSLRVRPGSILPGSVLLVDDLIDSRWTMTVAAWLLRSSGSDRVLPFALALSGR